MRKVKALELLAAAAIAAVPTVGFASDGEVGPARRQAIDRGPSNPFVVDFRNTAISTGKYTLVRPGSVPSAGPDADGTFSWVGISDASWQTAANWSPNSGFPDGANANAVLNKLSAGGTAQMIANTTLSSLTLSDPNIAAVAGPLSGAPVNMTMTNARTIFAQQIPSEVSPGFVTGRFFGAAIGLPAVVGPPAVPARPVIIAGSSGLIVDGMGAPGLQDTGKISIRFANTYTGGTTIQNGGQVTLLNQVDMNTAFGASGDITLNRGTIWVEVDNGVMNRNISVVGTNNALDLGTDPANTGTSTQTFNGVISGAAGSRLMIDGDFGGIGNFTNTNTFAGTLDVSLGTQVLSGNGAFASASSINNAASLTLVGGGVNRLPDAAELTMIAGALRMNNYTGGASETIGNMRLRGGTSAIIMQGVGAASLNAGNLIRENSGGLEIQANGLGTAGGQRVFFNNGTGQLTSGVFQYVFGHGADPFINGISSQATEILTYTADGVTPLSAAGGYSENAYTAGTNVRLQSDVVDETFNVPAGTTTINSLTMAPGFDINGNGVNGVHVGGTGVLNISGGVLLSSFDGFTTGNLINSGVGNVIDAGVTITAPTSELVLNSPGALTINGKITGNLGVTKLGIRTLFNNSETSDYTGQTVLSGFNRNKGNLPNNAPSAYGSASSAIIQDGNNRIQNDPGLGATGINGVSFGPDATNIGPTSIDRPLLVRGNTGRGGVTIISQIRNFSNFTYTMNGPITVEAGADLSITALAVAAPQNLNDFIINSVISGPGHVSSQQLQGNLTIAMNAQNTFTGGFDLAGGLVTLGADSVGFADGVTSGPLGAGIVAITGATFNGVQSSGGPRTVGNNILWNAGGNFTIAGTDPVTFTGNITTDPAANLLDVVAGNSTTFSGVLTGGSIFKQGGGTWHLSGANTTDGQINAANGSISGGMIVYRSNGAAGTSAGASAANFNNNTIAVTGGITVGSISPTPGDTGELMVMRGEGVGGLGALRNLAGNNNWTGDVLVQQTNSAPGVPDTLRGVICVDGAGDTLTISGSWSTSATALNPDGTTEPAGPLGVQKVGPGTVVIGSSQFSTGTGTFKGGIIASGNLNVAAGTVRMGNSVVDSHQPSVSDVPSISIAGGPGAATAKLDVGKNAFVVDYTGATPFTDIRAFLVQGYAGGAWTGNGIMSSDADAPVTNAGVGYVENSGENQSTGTTGKTTFFGNPVDNTAVLFAWTLYGDANVDGFVNLPDFNRLAANFGQLAGSVWGEGDFNYDGVVNLPDFNRLAANFGVTAGPDGPTPEDWAALASAVPEPGIISLAAVAGLGLLRRHRRSR